MLKIYWADAGDVDLTQPLPLSEYRRQRLAPMRHALSRESSLCAELLLTEAVRREDPAHSLPLAVEAEENGKPYLSDRDYEFSLSHSDRYAACALASFPVGLDIQVLTPCSEALVRRFFAEREREEVLRARDRDAAFTRLWCRKESFLKAIGLGLRYELSAFDTAGETPLARYQGQDYIFFDAAADGLFFSLCLSAAHRDELPPTVFRLP